VGLSVIGAIVGEFVGSNGEPASLGYLSNKAIRGSEMPLGFAFILASAALALTFFAAVRLMEHKMIGPWHPGEKG
jgi:ABC-type nitrate/sulfonate/bicarbonate transport system permease component